MPTPPPLEPLTERERSILAQLAAGATNAEIAAALFLTEGTIKWYNQRIFGKLGAKNRTDAVRMHNEQRVQTAAPDPAPMRDPITAPVMYGRAHELADVTALVSERRLVTVLGPGGMGKSTLALAVAHALQDYFPDGVWPVALAGLAGHHEVPSAIAVALGLVRGTASDPAAQLHEHLASKRALLLLDNFDEWVEAAPFVQSLIAMAPAVHVLCTSRERLNVSAEALYRLGGLKLAAAAEDAANATAELFLHHARRVQPNLRADATALSHIMRIARAVEGMPLALVLAASWVDALSLSEIAREVTQNFDLLSTELRDVPERHRSVRAVLDQTWSRLSAGEQQACATLSVFRGGFTRERAHALADGMRALPGAADAAPMLDARMLGALVTKSLIQRDGERYSMHELVRQHAAGKLRDEPAARAAHARHFMHALEVGGADAAEFDNVRSGWLHAIEANLPLAPLDLLRYCERVGRFSDAVALFTTALDAGVPPGCALHFARGSARAVMSDLDAAAVDLEIALTLHTANEPPGQGAIMVRLGEALRRAGHLDPAIKTLSAALEIVKQLPDAALHSETLFQLGWAHDYAGDLVLGSDFMRQSHDVAERHGLTGAAQVQALYGMGNAYLYSWHARKAAAQFLSAYDVAMAEGVTHYACEFLEMAGHSLFVIGEFAQARDLLGRTVSMAEHHGLHWMLAAAKSVHGGMRAALGEYSAGWRQIEDGISIAKRLKLQRFIGASALFKTNVLLDLGLPELAQPVIDMMTYSQEHLPKETAGYVLESQFLQLLIEIRRLPAAGERHAAQAEHLLSLIDPRSPFRWDEVIDVACELDVLRADFASLDRRVQTLFHISETYLSPIARLRGLYWQGVGLVDRADVAAALAPLREAQTMVQSMGHIRWQIRVQRALQRACAALGDRMGEAEQRSGAEQLIARIADDLHDLPELRAGLHTL